MTPQLQEFFWLGSAQHSFNSMAPDEADGLPSVENEVAGKLSDGRGTVLLAS